MKRKNMKQFKWVLLFLCFLMACPMSILNAWAASSPTKVKHKAPQEKYIPGFRINLDVEIQDKTGLKATRCYFKTKQDKNFGFVPLFNQGKGKYKAVLPAPWVNSEAVEYLFVAVNQNKQVTRTQLFTIEEEETKEATTWKDATDIEEIRLDRYQEAGEAFVLMDKNLKKQYIKNLPEFQTADAVTALTVNTELAQSMVPMTGFYDKALISEVASSEKYGLLAEGLYSSETLAAAGGTASAASATGAVTAGTVAATAGISTAVMVGTAVGVAAIAGGVAASSSSGGSGGDDGSGEALTEATILDYWDVTGNSDANYTTTGNITFLEAGNFTYRLISSDSEGNISSDNTGTGTWALSGTNLTLNFDAGAVYAGTASGDSISFTMVSSNGWTLNFQR